MKNSLFRTSGKSKVLKTSSTPRTPTNYKKRAKKGSFKGKTKKRSRFRNYPSVTR